MKRLAHRLNPGDSNKVDVLDAMISVIRENRQLVVGNDLAGTICVPANE